MYRRQDLSLCSPRKEIIHCSALISTRDLEGENQDNPDTKTVDKQGELLL